MPTAPIPIVFVPGLLCTAEVFAPQVAALWPHGPVTVASTQGGTTIAEIARSILETAPPRFALCGISMGGYICFEIVRQAPERVMKLALLDTSARPDTEAQTKQRHAMLAAASHGDFEAQMTALLTALLHPAHRTDATLLEVNRRMARTTGIDGLARQQRAIAARADSRPILSSIAVPTLVLVGENDQVTPPVISEEIASAIPGARLVVVPECGHASTIEQPAAVSSALIEWITG